MQNIVLIIHLFMAVILIGLVLMQRSEGGGLGASGGGGAVSSRSAANATTKLTWILAILFICTSISLTIISAANLSGQSVLDTVATTSDEGAGLLPTENLLPVAE